MHVAIKFSLHVELLGALTALVSPQPLVIFIHMFVKPIHFSKYFGALLAPVYCELLF